MCCEEREPRVTWPGIDQSQASIQVTWPGQAVLGLRNARQPGPLLRWWPRPGARSLTADTGETGELAASNQDIWRHGQTADICHLSQQLHTIISIVEFTFSLTLVHWTSYPMYRWYFGILGRFNLILLFYCTWEHFCSSSSFISIKPALRFQLKWLFQSMYRIWILSDCHCWFVYRHVKTLKESESWVVGRRCRLWCNKRL